MIFEDKRKGIKIEKVDSGLAIVSPSIQYSTDKGRISMLEPCFATMQMYEIYCLEGELFEDIERYKTFEETEARIIGLL